MTRGCESHGSDRGLPFEWLSYIFMDKFNSGHDRTEGGIGSEKEKGDASEGQEGGRENNWQQYTSILQIKTKQTHIKKQNICIVDYPIINYIM